MKRKKVSIRDIAKELKLSPTTVSFVLNGRALEHRINQDTCDLVLTKAKKLNYIAPQKKIKEKNILLLGMEAKNNNKFMYLDEVGDEILKELSLKGWNFHYGQGFDIDINELRKYNSIFIRVTGENEQNARKFIEKIEEEGIYPAILGRLFREFKCLSVDIDNYSGGWIVAKHLFENGHRNIAIVKGVSGEQHTEERLRGFKDFFNNENIEIRDDMIWGDGGFWIPEANRITVEKLKSGLKPTAIFYMCDAMALGGYYGLKELGLSISQDISIIGFDNDKMIKNLDINITTIKILSDNVGMRFAKILDEAVINNQLDQMQILCSAQLVEGNSVAKIIN